MKAFVILFVLVQQLLAQLVCLCQEGGAPCTTSGDCASGGCFCDLQQQTPQDVSSGSSSDNTAVLQVTGLSDGEFSGIVIGLFIGIVALMAFAVWFAFYRRGRTYNSV